MTDKRMKGKGFASRAIHAGEADFASATPIYQAATVGGRYLRDNVNPTIRALEEKIEELEGGARTVATASGMAAVSQTWLALLQAGDRLVVHHAVYVGVQALLDRFLPKFGIEVVQIDMTDLGQLAKALKNPAKVVHFEPVANASLEIIDAPAAIETAHQAGALAVIDNTFLSPYLFRPIEHGADVVIHSATKYLSGHGDALAGVVTTRTEELGKTIHDARSYFGGVLSPLNAFLVMRGIKTLPIRMEQHCANAQRVAEFLDGHPKIARVFYQGLPSSPGHEVAKSYLTRFGGMISFETTPDWKWDDAAAAENLRFCKPWVSLGDVSTLVLDTTQLCPGRARVSVGLEDVEDIIADLDQAIAAMSVK